MGAFVPTPTLNDMGTLTLTQLKTEIRQGLGGRTDLDDFLTNALNMTQTRIARAHKAGWSELERLYETNLPQTGSAEDDKFITFPTNTRAIFSFRLLTTTGSSRKLQRIPIQKWDNIIPEPEYYSRGKPSMYTLSNNTAELWKVPDSAYRVILRMNIWPTAFIDANDVASDFDEKDDMIIALSINYLMNLLGKDDKAARWWAIYRDGLSKALAAQETKPDMDIERDHHDGHHGVDYWRDPFIGHGY